MSVSQQAILDSLRQVSFPGFSRDVVSLGVVRDAEIDGDRVSVQLHVEKPEPELMRRLEADLRAALTAIPGVSSVEFRLAGSPAGGSASLKMAGARPSSSAAAAGSVDRGLIPDVRHTVAVASGKGGVGKSTVAVNLAISMARAGLSVGLLDADIYGPSIPIMMGAAGQQPELDRENKRLIPFEKFGVRFMSLGFLVEADSAVIWRGPMVMKAIEQLLRDVEWGALDVLLLDMPPGTGDAQLTVSQRLSLAGAVIVTTPQSVALADAVKGVSMFRKVDVPVLGIVENMSYFECPACSHRSEIFSHGGGRAEAERLGVPFLGEIPLDPAVRSSGDAGRPLAVDAADSAPGLAFAALAERIGQAVLQGPATDEPGTIFDRFRKVWPGSRD